MNRRGLVITRETLEQKIGTAFSAGERNKSSLPVCHRTVVYRNKWSTNRKWRVSYLSVIPSHVIVRIGQWRKGEQGQEEGAGFKGCNGVADLAGSLYGNVLFRKWQRLFISCRSVLVVSWRVSNSLPSLRSICPRVYLCSVRSEY